MSFIQDEIGGQFSILQYSPWIDDGIQHGVTGSGLNMRGESFESNIAAFRKALKVDSVFVLRQAHGERILDLRGVSCVNNSCFSEEYDSVLLSRTMSGSTRIAVGIRTADCAPILIRTDAEMLLIHAGWRGIANEIIPNSVRMLGGGDSEAVVGPCAGSCCYEVGTDVMTKIGDRGVFMASSSPNKKMLSVSASVERLLLAQAKIARVVNSDICTICDSRYHSFRRDGEFAGRNLAFVII